MTISTTYQPVTAAVSGVGPYTFEWEVIAAENVLVSIDDVYLSPSTYTVALTGSAPIYSGGSVTLNSPPPSGTLKIERSTPRNQAIDLLDYGPFPANTVELGLDKLTLISQESFYSSGSGGGGVIPTDFLPLAGGTMNDDAAIGFGTLSTSGSGRLGLFSLLGVPAFVVQPTSNAPDMGFVFQIDDAATKTLAASVDGTWAITGRPDFASLPDNAIATKGDVQTGGGQFLPLAGGYMDDNAVISLVTTGAGGGIADVTLSAVFGAPAFVVQPDAGQQDIGFVFQGDEGLTKYMAGAVDGTWSIVGRPAYSGLTDTAIALKGDVETRISRAGDTWDQGVAQIFPKDPAATDSSDLELAVINFFGITAWRTQAVTASTPNGVGYLFLTDQQNVATSFMVGSKLDGWRVRNQLFTDSDAIVTVQYLNDNTAGLPPTDPAETEWVLKTDINGENPVWVVNTGGSGGEANTMSSSGAGVSIVLPKVGADLPIKSFVAGANITITEQADTITIDGSGTVGVAWGTITGTLSAQTDLQAALDAKMSLSGGTWSADAEQDFATPAALPAFSGGTFGLANLLAIPTFLFTPQSGGGTEQVAYSLNTANTGTNRSLGGSVAAGWSIANQLLTSADNIVTRGLGDGRYAALSHTHTIAQVTGLQSELDDLQTQINGKAPSSAVNTATWGQIGGTLANQSDLQFALDGKASNTVNEDISGIWTFLSGFSASVGVVLSGGAICGGSRLQGVGDPQVGTDAATRAWVEANFVAI